MKTILVPTDYSDIANNACDYAVELAKAYDAKIILFHAYQVPLPSNEMPVMVITPQDLEKENTLRIKMMETEVRSKNNAKLEIESLTREGFTIGKIIEIIEEKNVDLVVMGVTGTGKISEALIGSHTSSLMKETQTPILVIPEKAKFEEVKKIVFAYNYNEKVNTEAIRKVKKFAKLFDAKIYVLDVEKPTVIPMYENTAAAETLENALKDVDHTLFYSSSDEITDGLNLFADEHKCDWVAMIPHKHTFWSRLFTKSNTKQMAFHTHLPLLSIHE